MVRTRLGRLMGSTGQTMSGVKYAHFPRSALHPFPLCVLLGTAPPSSLSPSSPRVPFAQPPVGKLRLRDPLPKKGLICGNDSGTMVGLHLMTCSFISRETDGYCCDYCLSIFTSPIQPGLGFWIHEQRPHRVLRWVTPVFLNHRLE